MNTPTATREQVDIMKGEIHAALWGPTGLYWRLPALEQELLRETDIWVEDHASDRDRQLVEVGPSDHLLGLFTAGPNRKPSIQVFCNEALAVGYSGVWIATHEAGHRFGYDHSNRPAQVALVDSAGEIAVDHGHHGRGAPKPAQTRVMEGGDSCPMCLLHARTAEVVGLLDGLQQRAHLQHQIPLGAGGVIPLSRRKTQEAKALLAVVAGMVPDRQGEIRQLNALLERTEDALDGQLDPADVSRAYAVAYRAHDAAWDLVHVYYLQALYGKAA